MRVTPVSIRETEAAQQAGAPALTPELLAATGARYSRSNDGLQAIIAKINPEKLDASVDSIFKMIDYGHQSIADMVPIAMFLDGISLYLAYYVWTLCPVAGGQESSTRYIQLSEEGLIDPEVLGIPEDEREEWSRLNREAFALYQEALQDWNDMAETFPERLRIPMELIQDENPKVQQKVARMIRNYNFDRARYFLPVSAATNMMLVMSARAWVTLCQNLCSHYLPEAKKLGEEIAHQLRLSAPRMIRHAKLTESFEKGIRRDLETCFEYARTLPDTYFMDRKLEADDGAFLDVLPVAGLAQGEMASALQFHHNRYDWFGDAVRRTGVRFGYNAVSFAEIRDLNRHRTGSKYCPMIPQGFYDAEDEFPENAAEAYRQRFEKRREFARSVHQRMLAQMKQGRETYIYSALLGTQFPFEHVTTADKFLYEAELRTGLGAHYRYAKHLADVLVLWKKFYPETEALIQAGTAEPE